MFLEENARRPYRSTCSSSDSTYLEGSLSTLANDSATRDPLKFDLEYTWAGRMSSVQPWIFSKQFKSSLSLTGVRFTGRELGRGSDAVVVEACHQGTLCAAKQLHQLLLGDQSSGGAQRLVDNFENEITTWYALRHPHIVLLLGVYFEHGSHIPTLVLEKMQTSLRRYVEMYKKEEVPLPDKVFILRQVSQALAYLHNCQPSLVHHDLSPNNILLNQDSLLTKITDFGMSRVVDLSHFTRKSSVKGTLAFMPPEALVTPPKYNEKLDVFTFGNVIIFTITHLWPEPGPPVVFEGDKPVAVLEVERREHYIKSLTVEEHSLFFSMIQSCLDNRPDRRPTSFQLVQQMRQMEEAHPRPDHSSEFNTTTQLTQQIKNKDDQLKENNDKLKVKDDLLKDKDDQLQEKDDQLKHIDEQLEEKDVLLKDKDDQLKEKDHLLKDKDDQLKKRDDLLKEKDDQLKEKDGHLKQMDDKLKAKDDEFKEKDEQLEEKDIELQLSHSLKHEHLEKRNEELKNLEEEQDVLQRQLLDCTELGRVSNDLQFFPSSVQALPAPQRIYYHKTPAQPCSSDKLPPRNWNQLRCQNVIEVEDYCFSVAVQGDMICIGALRSAVLFSKNSGIYTQVGRLESSSSVDSIAFLSEDTFIVPTFRGLRTYTTKGQIVGEFADSSGETLRRSFGAVTRGPDGQIFACDTRIDCIYIFYVNGKLLSSFSLEGKGVGHSGYGHHSDLCVGADGFLYITDLRNRRICVHTVEGGFIREFSTSWQPYSIAATPCNNLVVIFESASQVMIMTTDGEVLRTFGGFGSDPGRFLYPTGVAVDNEGCIYISDKKNCRVQIF